MKSQGDNSFNEMLCCLAIAANAEIYTRSDILNAHCDFPSDIGYPDFVGLLAPTIFLSNICIWFGR